MSHVAGDAALRFDLGKVSDALNQSVHDAGGATGAVCNFRRPFAIDRDAEQACGTRDDRFQLSRQVEVEAVYESEAFTQR